MIETTTGVTRGQERLQRRVLAVLASAQIIGGLGVGAGAAVGALLAASLSSDVFSGVSSAASTVGAALIAIPVSRAMDLHGRRPGLLLAYAIGILGALVVVAGASIGSFPLALLGLLAAGGGQTATLQSRYAATDLATRAHRGRALATVVWATTAGSVLGPNLASPMGRVGRALGIPELAGPYLLTVCVFLLAGALVFLFLRPDPLLVARAAEDGTTPQGHPHLRRSMREALETIRSHPAALLGLASIVAGQAVMVAVMAMTPVHLSHADASLEIIGLVISLHIAGMYAASPLVGIASDRYGRRPVIALGCAILLASFVIAGTASGHQAPQLAVGLFLLGLGWSCTMIAGSTLLTDATPVAQLPNVQGTADVLMGFGGASAGLLAGAVVAFGSYALLTILTAFVIVPLLVAALRSATSPASRLSRPGAAD